MSEDQGKRTWCLIGFATLDSDSAIFHHVKTAPAISADDVIHFNNERCQRLRNTVDGNWNALFESDDNLARL